MSKRQVIYTAFFCVILLIFFLSVRHKAGERHQEAPLQEAATESNIQTPASPAVTTVDLVVDDETGEILGEMVNQVGDYYIINPGDEIFIPIAGHSIKTVQIE